MSSSVQPSRSSSGFSVSQPVAAVLKKTGRPSGHTARTTSTTCRAKRIRFSKIEWGGSSSGRELRCGVGDGGVAGGELDDHAIQGGLVEGGGDERGDVVAVHIAVLDGGSLP